MKNNNKISHFLSLALGLGVCLTALTVMAQEIPVVDNVTEPTPVDFPGRGSLGEMKEAPLPSLADSVIKDPAPMERVVSKKELPSEQLLGRITSEVFHEMADLERGNVFLKLQAQREQLKNDLEALKAKYRQARLDEIEKREDVIRTRVKWQQEQEQIRQEILEKKLNTELLEKQLEEQEMAKEDLLPLEEDVVQEEVQEVEETPAPIIAQETPAETPTPEVKEAAKPKVVVFSIQKIVDIKGMKGRLTARVIDNNGKKLTLKKGDSLPAGYLVKEITKTDIVLDKDGTTVIYNIEELTTLNETAVEEETVEEQTEE